jgi:hypothetical protein
VMAALLGTLTTMFSVSLFGQPTNFFYALLALAAGMPALVTQGGRLSARSRATVDAMLPPLGAVGNSLKV